MRGLDAAARHLESLAAAPRPAGSPAEQRVRDYCTGVLRRSGFAVEEQRFEYSAFPGRYATTLAGLGSIVTLLTVGHLGARGAAWMALPVLAGAALLLGAGGLWMARRGVLDLPLLRRKGINLVARRGDARLWLVAHLDSKSQPIPILVRAAGITITIVVWLAALMILVLQIAGVGVEGWWAWLAAAGVAAGIPVTASTVGASSPGAADNASGVAAVLLALEDAPPDRPLAVLLTTAEELGLAGARAWARRCVPAEAVNVDTLDDRGQLVGMFTLRRPRALLETLAAAAEQAGVPFRARRLLPGVLVDGVALADAGWAVVTLSKGSAGTLARVHTGRDDLSRLRGAGVIECATLLGELLRRRG